VSFLGLAFLAALPLAAAPLLLHLFDRRRNVVIDWGAMQFLMEAATQRTSARKLKQWLLLLMRVLAIVAVVLALARPQLTGGWFGQQERAETIFVLDNSMSMQRTVGATTLFNAAVQFAGETLAEMKPGDSVRVLLSSPYPVWATNSAVRVDAASRSVIVDQLAELEPTNGRSDLLSALFTAAQAEIEAGYQRRRIVLLTDGQGSDWSIADEAGWSRFREVLKASAISTELAIHDLGRGSRDASNVAVNRIHASRTVVGLNQTFTMTAQIQNHGRTDSSACDVTWSIADEEHYQSQVPTLDGGQSHDVVWQHSFGATGVFAVTCQLDAKDELGPDNVATVVVEVVEEVPVLVVENSPDLAELQRDAFFVQAALGWDDAEALDQHGVFVPRLVTSEQLERLDLDDYRAVVIPNLTVLNDDVVSRLHEFVSRGGGLWIALGPRTDVEAFNLHFFADGDGLAPLELGRIIEEAASTADRTGRTHYPTLDASVNAHPATTGLADTERLDTRDVTVQQRFRFVPAPEGEDVSELVGLTNGEPVAVEKYVGSGRVIVQSIPLRLQWSQLARSQAFVVMVQDWLAYLTQPRATRHNLSPGDPITVHVADSETQDATLKTPHGDEIELTADAAGDGFVFRSSRTVLPGDYMLELGAAGDRIPFHVNRDPQESNLSALTTADNELLSDLSGLGRNPTGAGIAGSNQTDPIWPMLLMALIGLIVAELILSGMISRERFGNDPIAETTEQIGAPGMSAMASSSASSSAMESAGPFSTGANQAAAMSSETNQDYIDAGGRG
jgi:hypothetical protein